MKSTDTTTITGLLEKKRDFFATGITRPIDFRLKQLKQLQQSIRTHEKRILAALRDDLGKSAEEGYLTEVSIVLGEIRNHIRHVRSWTRPQRVPTPLALLPSSSRMHFEPLGVALIVAPWNYPFQLLFNPLIGAISAGCCAILKPSPYAPAIAGVMEEIISETLLPEYISTVQGGREVNSFLLTQRFDMIFFTGSPELGKVVMRAASEHLTPVVLELGGKSPCIVDTDANLAVAARRIVWGKTINAGQTCIAPDYLLVHQSVKEELIAAIGREMEAMFGSDVSKSPWYPRIVTPQAMNRLGKLLEHGTIRVGGQVIEADKFIAPTVIDGITGEEPVMQEEIFGPILPVITYSELDEALKFIREREKPLALYYFGPVQKGKAVFSSTPSGGGCINDTLMHIANHHLPFGGTGNSGMGKYHGYDSFLAFTNRRSVVTTPTWIDLPFRYVPFRFFGLIRKIL